MTRFVHVTVLVMVVAAVLGAGRIANAQETDSGSLPNGAKVWFEDLQIVVDGKSVETELTSDARLRYFNLAHCNCAKAMAGEEQSFSYLIHASGDTGLTTSVTLDLFAGSSICNNDTERDENENCKYLDSISDIRQVLWPEGVRKNFNLFQVINGVQRADEECLQTEGDVPIYAFANTKGQSNRDEYDFKTSQNVGLQYPEMATTKVLDTKPPPLPTQISAKATDGGIRMSWTPPESDNADVAYYQALCARMDGMPARSKEQDAKYVTTASLCDVGTVAQGDPELEVATLTNDGTPVERPTGEFGALNDDYVCGHADGGTSRSLEIVGLENGTPYQLIIVAVDLHGNNKAAYLTSTVTPVPAIDFWEDLNDRNGDIEGGFCLLAETYGDDSSLTRALRAFRDDTLGGSSAGRWLGDLYYATLGKLGAYVHGSLALRIVAAIALAPVVALAVLWHWLTLPGLLGLIAAAWLWPRRRAWPTAWGNRLVHHRSIHLAAGIAMVIVGASPAHAGGYQPYWENSNLPSEEESVAPDDPSLVRWHAGVRVGPYLPDIDKQLGMSDGPFEQMFGGARPMPMLDVDRVLWTGFGQVAVGGSIGYMQWFAHSFVDGSMPGPMRPRSPGDTNTFRLIPLALTGTYRFTYLDDEYGIPVVPYVRGGLAYDIWWLKSRGNRVCKDGSTDLMCELDKPRGGSLGVQGSIGLAIRAERIDASTANSMRQSGIQHAGIYGELSLAKVDGFGSDSKLSLGDRTWFAGVNFEF